MRRPLSQPCRWYTLFCCICWKKKTKIRRSKNQHWNHIFYGVMYAKSSGPHCFVFVFGGEAKSGAVTTPFTQPFIRLVYHLRAYLSHWAIFFSAHTFDLSGNTREQQPLGVSSHPFCRLDRDRETYSAHKYSGPRDGADCFRPCLFTLSLILYTRKTHTRTRIANSHT